MTDVSSWSPTDASNNSSAPAGFPEGMAPSGVNNSARAVMGGVRRAWERGNVIADATGAANVYVTTYSVAPAAYVDGEVYAAQFAFANTATSSWNINSLGAKPIVRADGGSLESGDIVANQFVQAAYDSGGDRFVMLSPVGYQQQPKDAQLTALAGLSPAINQVPIFSGATSASLITVSTAAQAILVGTSNATILSLMDEQLAALAGLSPSANQVPIFSGATSASLITVTSFAQTVLDDTDAASVRSTLGLGTAATSNSGDFIAASARGAANGVASLGADGRVPASQIQPDGGQFDAATYTVTNGTVGGTADAITLTVSPTPSSYTTGFEVSWVQSGANTTTVTVNVNSLGAKALKTAAGAALSAGELLSGTRYTAQYDGTDFRLKGPWSVANATTAGLVKLATSAEVAAGATSATPIVVTPETLATNALYQGKHTIPLPGDSFTPNTTNGAASGSSESATNKRMLAGIDFDAATAESAQRTFRMPVSWNEGTVSFIASGYSTATNTGNVVIGMRAIASGLGDTLDSAFGTGAVQTLGTASNGVLMVSTESAAITIAGTPAAGDLVTLQVYRDATAAADTLVADFRLLDFSLLYTINAKNDG